MTPEQAAELLAADQVQLVDVRERHEYEAGRIAASRWIPLAELAAQAGSIDRTRPVVFVCRSGGRSAMATEAFAGAGYDARNLTGGMKAWQLAGLPLEPEGGEVA